MFVFLLCFISNNISLNVFYVLQSFSSLNNIFDNTQIPISSDFPNKSEEFSLNDFSPQSLNMTNNFSNSPQFLQQESPSIATSTELDWITTSNTDIKIQSPLDPSSPRTSMSPLYSSRSKSSMLIQSSGSSFERSSPDVSISHHEFPTSSDSMGKYTNATSPAVKPVEPPKKTKGTPGRKRKFQDHEVIFVFILHVFCSFSATGNVCLQFAKNVTKTEVVTVLNFFMYDKQLKKSCFFS